MAKCAVIFDQEVGIESPRKRVRFAHPPPHSGAVEFVREDYGGEGREGDMPRTVLALY